MVRYRTHLVRSRTIYVLLLLGALCAIGFAACLAVDKYPRLEKAFVVGAGASFSVALLTVLILLARGRLPETDLGGGEFAWRPKGSPLRAALLGAAGLVLVFVFGVLPRLMGVDLGVVMDVIAVLALLLYGYLAYVEFRGKREDKE